MNITSIHKKVSAIFFLKCKQSSLKWYPGACARVCLSIQQRHRAYIAIINPELRDIQVVTKIEAVGG